MSSYFRPKILLYALLTILFAVIFIVVKPQDPAVFLIWLAAVILIVLIIRFKLMSRLIYLDLAVFLSLLFFYKFSIYFLLPSLMLLLYDEKIYATVGFIFIWAIFAFLDVEATLVILIAFLGGLLLYIWKIDQRKTIHEIDHLREKIYDLETEGQMLVNQQHEMMRLGVLQERDRIAQKLHDDLGHELTGALMALRAFEAEEKNATRHKSYIAMKDRVEKAVKNLKQTVHHTEPEESYGFEAFNSLIQNLDFAKVYFDKKGLMTRLSATHWQVFHTVLKEAITNISKHANAKEVYIELHVEQKVVKLTIKNDGIKDQKQNRGKGLSFMRKRIETLGGTMTIQKSFYFTLICVVPLNIEVGD